MTLLQAEHHTGDIVQEPQHTGSTAEQLPAADSTGAHAGPDIEPHSAEIQAKAPTSTGQLLKHINFWHEDELKLAHPEVQASLALG